MRVRTRVVPWPQAVAVKGFGEVQGKERGEELRRGMTTELACWISSLESAAPCIESLKGAPSNMHPKPCHKLNTTHQHRTHSLHSSPKRGRKPGQRVFAIERWNGCGSNQPHYLPRQSQSRACAFCAACYTCFSLCLSCASRSSRYFTVQ